MDPGRAGPRLLAAALAVDVLVAAGVVVAAGAAVAARAAPEDPLAPVAPPARTAEFVRSVNDAVDRGVDWLRGARRDGLAGSDPALASQALGYEALALYTLRACGVPADDPEIVAGFRSLRDLHDAARRSRALTTYTASLCLLALEAHWAPPAARGGGRAPAARRIPEADREWCRLLARWLQGAQTPGGGFGYGTDSPQGWEDHSNTQFALLGLKAARRCGVEVPRAVFRASLDHLLRSQEGAGPAVERRETGTAAGDRGTVARSRVQDRARGWTYREGPRMPVTGSMTAGGVSSLVICRGELLETDGYGKERDREVVQAIRDGLAWLGRNFTVTENPGMGPSGWHYYYLYGLERAGVLAGVSWMASRDWYLEGARHLVAAQGKDGGWASGNAVFGPRAGRRGAGGGRAADPLDTCFALLFLRKATFRVEGAVATEEATAELDLTGAPDLDEASYRAVFDTVFGRFLRARGEQRGALAPDFVRLGTRALGLLILELEGEEEADREAAIDALRRVTGRTEGFAPAAPQEARTAAVESWERWYFDARRRGIEADVGSGRFRDPGPR